MLKKTFFAFGIVFIFCASGLRAGDTASFVDLGFSPDGAVYVFAQYGVQSGTLKPWADLFVVDVLKNNFVPGGKVSFVHNAPVAAGSDGSGALYRVIANNSGLAARYGVNYLISGQPLYIALNDNLPPGAGECIEFRDFETGASYKAVIQPKIEGSGANLKSSFFISLERTARNGARKTYTLGSPQVKRPLITSYQIRKVIIAPGNGSMIFVIETKKEEGAGVDIRYMVEALRL